MIRDDDPDTMSALQVLTDAVRRERIPGVVEFRQLEDALKDVATDPSGTRWASADAAFNALEPDIRQRVADRANQLAVKEAENRRRGTIGGAPMIGNASAGASGTSLSVLAEDIGRRRSTADQQTTGFEDADPDGLTTMDSAPAPQPRKPSKLGGASPFLAALNRGRGRG